MTTNQKMIAIQAPEYVSMKGLSGFIEADLEAALTKNIELLGLGLLDVKNVQHTQSSGGRLDLLLSDPNTDTRYEVELQLGSLDESHIIRAIEYWDIERQRYPHYEHVAVVVAEDVTSRFHNVIQLIGKGIPLIAIELRMVKHDGAHFLVATQVVKLQERGTEEEEEGDVANRDYWIEKGTAQTVGLMDATIALINQVVPEQSVPFGPKFNQEYVGLTQTGSPVNFAAFRPKKKFLHSSFKIPHDQTLTERLEESGIDLMAYEVNYRNYRVRLYPDDIQKFNDEIRELIQRAYESYFGTQGAGTSTQ